MAADSRERGKINLIWRLVIVGVFLAGTIAAAPCPKSCTCPDILNRHVNCSHKPLLTPPVTSRLTLTLDLSHTGLGPIINDSMRQMPVLTYIDLSDNALTRLLGCTLSGMLKLETVLLHHNRLTDLPDSLFTDANQVKHLDLSHNLFTQLPDDAFRNLPELRTLDLSHNLLVNITMPTRFQVIRNIELIDFSYNPIEVLQQSTFEMATKWENGIDRTINLGYCSISQVDPQALAKIPHVYDLTLSGNNRISQQRVKDIIKAFENSSLERLSLANMNLSTVESLFTQVTQMSLKFLNLSSNEISAVGTNVFSTIGGLQVLDLSNNTVTELGAGFSDLINLQVLNLSLNRLGSFRGNPVPRLTKLHTLVVSHNRLSYPDQVQFSSLDSLRHFDANNNLLTAAVLPTNTSTLQYLDLHSNSITEYKGLEDAVNLEVFDISDNDLTKIPHFLFAGGMKIKYANFSKNSITEVDPRAFLPLSPLTIDLSHNFLTKVQYSNWVATQRLYLNGNRIKEIQSQAFFNMGGLAELDLSQNKLTSLHEDTFQYLTALKHLNLSYNQLDKVPWFDLFRNLVEVKYLDLSHNNISWLNATMLLPLPGLQMLLLSQNHLHTVIPLAFRDLSQNMTIDLSYNPFNCGCDLITFRDWLMRTTIKIAGLDDPNSTGYRCKSPAARAGLHVTRWKEGDFECDTSLLYIIIFSSIGAFLILAGIIGTAAYRLVRKWREKRAERARRRREDMEMRKRILKADHVRMTSQEIAEEIREAIKRKQKLGDRQFDTENKSNSYVTWPETKRKEVGDDEKEDEGRRARKDWRYYYGPGGERRPREGEWRRGPRDSELWHPLPVYAYVDKYGTPIRRRSIEYEDVAYDRRYNPYYGRGMYWRRDPRDPRYATDSAKHPRPFMISQPAYSTALPGRWEPVDSWGGPQLWTLQGYRRRSRSQGPRAEGYMTMPARYERERINSRRVEDPDNGRYPPEVHFEPRDDFRRQSSDDPENRQRARRQSQSYNNLVQGEAEDLSAKKRDRAQRQYESIETTRRESAVSQRSMSQPFLPTEQSSGWL